tara:strand:- start:362 stop:589 length:228 start_codon:yes stop_codon:yes gene_type:complete
MNWQHDGDAWNARTDTNTYQIKRYVDGWGKELIELIANGESWRKTQILRNGLQESKRVYELAEMMKSADDYEARQ